MGKGSWLAGAGLACWVLTTGMSFGFVPPAPPAADARPAQTMRAKDVLGSKVSLKGGLAIGTVDDIIFDDDGGIDYLVVQNEGKDVLVPWEAAKFDFGSRAATVDITQDQYRTIPTYAPTEFPANVYEPAFQTKIYGYYNLKPRERREIRRDRP